MLHSTPVHSPSLDCTRTMLCPRLIPRVAGRLASLARPVPSGATGCLRAMSAGHDVDLMDKKLYPKDYHPATYDDHIIPAGSWQQHNAALQSKYNGQLAAGVLFFLATVYYMYLCPEVDLVLAPKSIGVNPPKFSVLPPKDA